MSLTKEDALSKARKDLAKRLNVEESSIKEKSTKLTVLAGDRNSILVAGALLRQPIRLSYASGGTSGHSRTRDVRFWHLADIPPAPTNVRLRG